MVYETAQREVDAYTQLKGGPNIVTYHCAISQQLKDPSLDEIIATPILFFDYVSGGDLLKYSLALPENVGISEPTARFIFKQLVAGTSFMHS